MNLTSNGSIHSNAFKQLKATYIVAACGIALAASAVAASTPWQSNNDGRASEGLSSVTFTRQASDVDLMPSILSSESAIFGLTVAAPSAREATDANIMAGVISGESATYDMNAAPVAPIQSSAANIMASVISGEHAAYVFDAAPVVASKTAEANIMAGVLSGEHASNAFTEE